MFAGSPPWSRTRPSAAINKVGAGVRRHGAGEMPAERARSRDRAKQAVQMAGNGMQPRALRQFTLDVRN